MTRFFGGALFARSRSCFSWAREMERERERERAREVFVRDLDMVEWVGEGIKETEGARDTERARDRSCCCKFATFSGDEGEGKTFGWVIG